ncbi:Aste57867_20418 [Aphanomyces stellatus]|uniref:Aste57867_20418 protein n=1 Tax=Aphanomyces stellatus TaxID=120398 RepID=A0A485LFM7_9STRA|nr:hypothetical protein As57867_020352 [Aphanomyces stellatus]VFT97104.1 Aste57867_20418 [Aphanomyces stellatus]
MSSLDRQPFCISPINASKRVISFSAPPDSISKHRKHQLVHEMVQHAAEVETNLDHRRRAAAPPHSNTFRKKTTTLRRDRSWIFDYQHSSTYASVDLDSFLTPTVTSEPLPTAIAKPHEHNKDTESAPTHAATVALPPKAERTKPLHHRMSVAFLQVDNAFHAAAPPDSMRRHAARKMTQYTRLDSFQEHQRETSTQLASECESKLSSLQTKVARQHRRRVGSSLEERLQDAIDRIPRVYLHAPDKENGAKRVQFAHELEQPMFPPRSSGRLRRGSL